MKRSFASLRALIYPLLSFLTIEEEPQLLNFAIQTARDAGRVLADKMGRALQVSNKGAIDLVTEADLASEKLIIERIKSHYPRHSILAEESGASENNTGASSAEWKWIEIGRAHV